MGDIETDSTYAGRLQCEMGVAIDAALALIGSAIDLEATDELPVVLDILGLRERICDGRIGDADDGSDDRDRST